MTVRSVAILALPGCRFSGLAAVLDLCRQANLYTGKLFAAQDGPRTAMRTVLLTPHGRNVRFADGRTMPADGVIGAETFDAVYVTSFDVAGDAQLQKQLSAWADVREWLARQRAQGARIAGAGSAVLVLAHAGLLSGGEAAAPPEHAALMRKLFADVRTDGVGMLANASGVHTASVIGAEPSLAMRLLDDAFSRVLGDYLTKVTRITEAGFAPEAPYDASLDGDEVVRRAQTLIQQRFTQKCPIPEIAAAVAVSQKVLTRRFRQQLGMTPQAYLQHLRMEAAKRQLTHTNRRVERVAALVGYGDVGFFKEKFRAHAGVSPLEFRQGARARGERTRKLTWRES